MLPAKVILLNRLWPTYGKRWSYSSNAPARKNCNLAIQYFLIPPVHGLRDPEATRQPFKRFFVQAVRGEEGGGQNDSLIFFVFSKYRKKWHR